MLVYRMEVLVQVRNYREDRDWIGPFCAAEYDRCLERCTNKFKDDLCGPINEPFEDNPSMPWICGMISGVMDYYQFRCWFPSKRTWGMMASKGFVIGVYDVERADLGVCDSQVFWHPNNATRVGEITVDKFLDEFDN